MKMNVTFNTGRQYQRDGQVITAVQEGGKILFADHSRMIYGEMPAIEGEEFDSPYDFARRVMRQYDSHQYRMSVEAMQLRRPVSGILSVRM